MNMRLRKLKEDLEKEFGNSEYLPIFKRIHKQYVGFRARKKKYSKELEEKIMAEFKRDPLYKTLKRDEDSDEATPSKEHHQRLYEITKKVLKEMFNIDPGAEDSDDLLRLELRRHGLYNHETDIRKHLERLTDYSDEALKEDFFDSLGLRRSGNDVNLVAQGLNKGDPFHKNKDTLEKFTKKLIGAINPDVKLADLEGYDDVAGRLVSNAQEYDSAKSRYRVKR